ncbi:MAG TPA: inner membrane protein YhjD [Corynebacterium nuruki]|uniref:Inner membrane protein YhjD n=1 Tax=Corynebacterium nuruki TaxID=1032851 RepID=A0A3D4SXF3_9CORY|nr:inner membrane protein YhjD [Corynebacterium nuruki]
MSDTTTDAKSAAATGTDNTDGTPAGKPSKIDGFREKWPWLDHVMHMNDRYGEQGGNQFAAGITYFSVLSLFPLIMLVMAVAAMVLAGNQDLLDKLLDKVTDSGEGGLGDTLSDIINTAINQRGSVFGIGLVLTVWTGLGWIGNLRMGISAMWRVSGKADSFLRGKISDFIALVGLLLSLIIAFAVTAVGSGGFTWRIIQNLNMDHVTGIRVVVYILATLIALAANWVVMFWLLMFFPRAYVPRPAAVRGAVIGAIAFEIFKQFAAVFFNNTMSNPAGAAFGPIIGVMVLLYFVWRITLYCSAWVATAPESIDEMVEDAPLPAVIQIRAAAAGVPDEAAASEQAERNRTAGLVGAGAAAGAIVTGIVTRLFRK